MQSSSEMVGSSCVIMIFSFIGVGKIIEDTEFFHKGSKRQILSSIMEELLTLSLEDKHSNVENSVTQHTHTPVHALNRGHACLGLAAIFGGMLYNVQIIQKSSTRNIMHVSIILVLELPAKLPYSGSLIKWIEWGILREWPLLFAITHQWSGYSLLHHRCTVEWLHRWEHYIGACCSCFTATTLDWG